MVLVTLSTPEDLYTLMVAPLAGPSGTFSLLDDYDLANSINMTGYTASSIGYNDLANGFQGNFNGNGHTVTLGNITNTYCGFFYFTSGSVEDLTVKYINNGIVITDTTNNANSSGGLMSLCAGNVSNCHIILPNNVTIGKPADGFCGGFIGNITSTISNCSLIVGDSLSIIGNNFTGGFIGNMNGGLITNCFAIIGNNLLMTGADIGGVVGFGFIINNFSLTIGDNCSIISTSNQYIGGIIGDTANTSLTVLSDIKAIYGDNTTITGSTVGGVGGQIYNVATINNTIVLFKDNTQLTGSIRAGGILGRGIADSNVFALYNDYSIIAPSAGAIYGISAPIGPSILANSCGIPLVGSNVTDMSTISLGIIIGYLQTIPYLVGLIPYIEATYCPNPVIPSIINQPECNCTAELCTSNPQVTNYDESEDKSRRADQTVRSNLDVKLLELQNGTRISSVPIFKSYQEMMMWKQGACKYRR